MSSPNPIVSVAPAQPKAVQGTSWAQTFVDKARQEIAAAPPVSPVEYVKGAGSVIGEYTEGGIVGSLLGATHARFGLDTPMGPTDGWLAVMGAIMGVGLSGHWPVLAARARGVGSKAFTVMAFRKSFELVKGEPLLGGSTAPGVQRLPAPGTGPRAQGEDPIEVAARGLG